MEKEREWGKDMFGGSGNGNRKGCGGYVEYMEYIFCVPERE